ncbi:UNVERIFIED_CONTAM: Aspartyl protease AED3 [Sesamum angustifolium]|uniref:Aspartyl protease AED3 n=1 Tax=Sesamum angustifolium TaxID=2727405 RepID=A0AAW2KD79_9LAMI
MKHQDYCSGPIKDWERKLQKLLIADDVRVSHFSAIQACHTLQFATGNSGSCGNNAPTCNYVVTYGDGSYSHGELGSDHLVLGTTPVENFVFGCGRNNKGLFGAASGLMGLGRSDLSLISQTSNVFGGVFSYCLPDSDAASFWFTILGNDTSAYKNTTPISYTKLVPNPQLSSFYILNLTGTSVGGVALSSPSFGTGGILIDSGTVCHKATSIYLHGHQDRVLKQFRDIHQHQVFQSWTHASTFQHMQK